MIPSYHKISRPDVEMLLYHDPYSGRIRVDEWVGDLPAGQALLKGNAPGWAEKIIVKARREQVPYLLEEGWIREATIPGYFSGEDLFFLVHYPHLPRSHSGRREKDLSITRHILDLKRNAVHPSDLPIRRATREDANKLASLYQTVFSIYPTPLDDPAYLRKTMDQGTVYVYIEQDGVILSAASAEINRTFSNAELTDCATLPSQQGQGHMAALLAYLEEILIGESITCLYTICRSASFAMNKVFYNLGYDYGGCLLNNCNIYSGIENMNVRHKWVK